MQLCKFKLAGHANANSYLLREVRSEVLARQEQRRPEAVDVEGDVLSVQKRVPHELEALLVQHSWIGDDLVISRVPEPHGVRWIDEVHACEPSQAIPWHDLHLGMQVSWFTNSYICLIHSFYIKHIYRFAGYLLTSYSAR